jgi:RHS repeat-associated protein
VRFDPWWQQIWDVNDTVTLNSEADPDVAAWFNKLAPGEYSPSWYALRTDPANAGLAAQRWPDAQQRAAEADAANKTAEHAGTPAVTHLDSLGRVFLTVADNGAAGKFCTRVHLDVENNQRAVLDALDRTVTTQKYDMSGGVIHQASMEAGERWMLNDVVGKPMRAWDSRGHAMRNEYDALHRPLRNFVRGADAQGPTLEILVGKAEYGEGQPNDVQLNLRTKAFRLFDASGVVTNEGFDFKGNLLRSSRQLAQNYQSTANWAVSPALEPRVLTSSTSYDAMNRPASATAPDASEYRATYNAGNLLETVKVRLRGAATATTFVSNIDYDAKGQRERIEYGNGVRTQYRYDPLTFRLMELETTRASDLALLQKLIHTYDPTGNITRIRDDARQAVYFNNQVVTPENNYRYDATYRLIHAEGREHIGQVSQPQTSWNDQFRPNLPQPGDGPAMRRYREDYRLDAAGNFLQLIHQAANGNWTRDYEYHEASQIEAALHSNRLSRSSVGASTSETFTYDAHGNIISIAHLSLVRWDFKDQLCATSRQVVTDGTPETTYYVYDGGGKRTRKVTERQNGTRKNERVYLNGFELYREYDSSGTHATLERETFHVMGDRQRIAIAETRLPGDGGPAEQLLRYQFGNHLGSSSLELDEDGRIISYEEYFPYGSTSYQAVRSGMEASPKRYRFTAMERDDETGFSYHGARYYMPWLGRWSAADPAGLTPDGTNLYAYVANDPVSSADPTGFEGEKGEFLWSKTAEENDYRHQFLMGARQILIDHGFSIERLRNWFDEYGQLEILKKYGYEKPGFTDATNADCRRVLNQDRVVAAIDRYDAEWKAIHHIGGQHMSEMTVADIDAQNKAQLKREEVDAWIEGTGYVTTSLAAATAAYVASKFTDDQKTITAVAGAVHSLASATGSYAYAKQQAGTYKPDVVNKPPPKPPGPDFTAPRGTDANPIPAWELIRTPTQNNSRYIPVSVSRFINRVMNSPYMRAELAKWGITGPISRGSGAGTYQIGHDPGRPYTATPKGTPTKVFGQLFESNIAGSDAARATRDAWVKLGIPVRKGK